APICDPVTHGCRACASAADCPAATPVCAASGACVVAPAGPDAGATSDAGASDGTAEERVAVEPANDAGLVVDADVDAAADAATDADAGARDAPVAPDVSADQGGVDRPNDLGGDGPSDRAGDGPSDRGGDASADSRNDGLSPKGAPVTGGGCLCAVEAGAPDGSLTTISVVAAALILGRRRRRPR